MRYYKYTCFYRAIASIVLFFFVTGIAFSDYPEGKANKNPWPDDGNLTRTIHIFSSHSKYFDRIDESNFEFLKYALIVRNIAVRELLAVRIELLEHQKALNPYYFATTDNNVIERLREEFPKDKFLDTSLLVEKAANVTSKKDNEYINKFIKRAVSVSIELMQLDERIKFLNQVKRSNIRYDNTVYRKKPCLLNEWTGGWYSGTYTVADVKGGYENYTDLPEMKKLDEEIADLARQRKYVLDSMHIAGTPFFNNDENFIVNLFSDKKEPSTMLYELLFWELFNEKFGDYKRYYDKPIKPRRSYPYYSDYEERISTITEKSITETGGNIEPKSALKVKMVLATGIREALRYNSDAISHILKRNVPQYIDNYSVKSYIEHLSFLSQFSGITDYVVKEYKRISPYGNELQVRIWNRDLAQVYKDVERRYEISLYALIGMGTLATIFLWGSGVVLYAAVGTISLMGVMLAYQNYSRISGELTFIKSLFYDLRKEQGLRLRDGDLEKYIIMEEEAFRDLVIAGVAVGIDALFFLRFAHAARLSGKSIAISKESIKNCFIKHSDKPAVYFKRIREFVTAKEATPWRVQKIIHSLTKGNSLRLGKILTVGSFLYFIVDFYNGESSETPFIQATGDKSEKYLGSERRKIEFDNKIEIVSQILQDWDRRNNSRMFWQFYSGLNNADGGFIGIHDLPYTLKNGNYFFINYKIAEHGTPQNIIFEVALATYLSIMTDMSLARTADEKLRELEKITESGKYDEAVKFAISIGGIEF